MTDEVTPFPRAQSDALCTKELYRFLKQNSTMFEFFFFGLRLATDRDRISFVAAEALARNGAKEDQERFAKVRDERDRVFKELQRFGRFQSENMCIRAVDNFLNYLSEIIQSCMRSRPDMLKSSEMIRIEDILKFDTHVALVEFLVERKINELSYGGIKEINGFLSERTGIELWNSQEERALLSIAIELRNIYTHNRGVVNKLFLDRTKGMSHRFEFKQGKRYTASYDDIILLTNNMFALASRVDGKVGIKFGLKQERFDRWDVPAAAAVGLPPSEVADQSS